MSKRLNTFAEIAYKEALKAKGGRHRHGAVVATGSRILAKACNNYKNGCHAEVRAIKRIPHDARDSATELIVVRAKRNQKWGLSKPCRKCQKAISDANIKVVYYSTDGDVLSLATYGD